MPKLPALSRATAATICMNHPEEIERVRDQRAPID
jgi:hypothetical protein